MFYVLIGKHKKVVGSALPSSERLDMVAAPLSLVLPSTLILDTGLRALVSQ